MRLAYRRGFSLAFLMAATLGLGSQAQADGGLFGGYFKHFPQQVPGIDYSTGVPFLTAPYVYSKHDFGHGAGCGCATCAGGHSYGYSSYDGCSGGSCYGHGGGAGVSYGSPYYGKKPLVFFGAGGPVYLNPGHPDSAGYINVTRSPRDFFAFPPYDPNPPF